MAEYEKKKYNYTDALKIKESEEIAIAEKHHSHPGKQRVSMNFVFDSTKDAGDFSQKVLQPKSGRTIFKLEPSFINPRSDKSLPKDYSELSSENIQDLKFVKDMNAIEPVPSLVVDEEMRSPPPPYDVCEEREKRIKKKQRPQQQPYIRTIVASGPIGDVLDREQQWDVLNKYFAHPQIPPQSHTPIGAEASEVASLKSIWVFRLKSLPASSSDHHDMPVWTSFDIANQTLLTQHRSQAKGIEIFDSHIRQGKLPVLVIPQSQLGYFPVDMIGNTIATLEVACLNNSKDLGFVYRKTPRYH